jgi:hypothetical protein
MNGFSCTQFFVGKGIWDDDQNQATKYLVFVKSATFLLTIEIKIQLENLIHLL